MRDLFFADYGEKSFLNTENQLALSSQIGIFLSTKEGELKYDIDYGLDRDLLLNNAINDDFKSKYIRNKLKKYFSKRVKEFSNVFVKKNVRKLEIKVKYISIYSEEVQEIEV